MKTALLFFVVGFLSVLLQTTFLHLLPLGPLVPDLTLVLCVYWGLNYPTVGAVLGSFLLGYSIDVFSSPLLGLNAFAMSLVFLAVYLASRCIWVQNPTLGTIVVFGASWVKAAALLIAGVLFLPPQGLWPGILKYVFIEAVLAAIMAPWLFAFIRKGESYVEEVGMPL
jgi:rod shape-determining protein MreD